MQIDNNLIKQAWQAAELSYFLDKNRTCSGVNNLEVLYKIFDENISCFILRDSYTGDIFVAFPGSNDWRDWIKTNINHDVRDGYHEGFLNAWERIHEEIDKYLAVIPGPINIHVTGHSLGGALAHIYFDKSCLHRDAKCITFAQPRIATEARYYVDGDYLRVFTANDPIIHLPSSHDGFVFPEGNALQLGNEWTKRQKFKRVFNRKVDYAEEHDKAFYKKMVGELK